MAFLEASGNVSDELVQFHESLETMKREATPERRRDKILDEVLAARDGLNAVDSQIREEFLRTENVLSEAGLPQEISTRHEEAVQDYEENLSRLQDDLNTIDQLHQEYTGAIEEGDPITAELIEQELEAKVLEVDQFLQENVKDPPHTPLDPNQLPNRTPKVKERKPRLQKEDFVQYQKPIQLAFNGDLTSFFMAQATSDLPTPEDLAETIEVQFTQEIQDLAAQLEHNPLKIYNWVRNNIDFVPTYGSIQGANMCLLTKRCNDMDTASLLIALMRVSGVASRYVIGTVEIPIDKVMNWVGGFEDERAALNFIASNGTPGTALTDGSNPIAVQMEHVWVEAYVDYIPSRGGVHTEGDTWVPLDASYKQFTFTPGVDVVQAINFDAQSFVNQVESTATINEQEGFVANLDAAFIETTITDVHNQFQDYVDTNLPDVTVVDLIGVKSINEQAFPVLPASLPYRTLVVGTRFSSIPNSLSHTLSFEVTPKIFFGTDLFFEARYSELVGKRVTLSYVPATTEDQQTVDSFGGLYETPPYLIRVKPQLKVEGVVVSEGAAAGAGTIQNFTINFTLPTIGSDQIQNDIIAGGYYAVGLVSDRLPSEYSAELQKRATELESFVIGGGDRLSDFALGEQLYISAMTYFWEVDNQTDALASQADIIYAKHSSEGIFGLSLSVASLFGAPRSVKVTGTTIDVDRAVYVNFSKSGDLQIPIDFLVASGFVGSSSEHAIIEQLYEVQAISAIKAIQIANAQGLKNYTITQTSIASILPLLQVSPSVKNDIQNAVNAGKEVFIPEREIQLNDWNGIGYIVSDPSTGAAGYLISGGIGGGSGTLEQAVSEIIEDIMDKVGAVVACLSIRRAAITRLVAMISATYFVFKTVPFPILKLLAAATIAVLAALLLSIVANCLSKGFARRDNRRKFKTFRYA